MIQLTNVRKLEKEKQYEPKVNERKEIDSIKIRGEISKIKNGKIIEKINEIKSGSLKRE